ncbi:ATP phosphoribosyltransferase regulatory subunit [Apilactobacillus kunkeei]|nr:ATP phosphoribosyltransferase regulatory subunit [Apilactobacillus kunkeei]
MRYQRPKGTADILPGTSEKWQFVEETARKLFAAYRYQEIRTPMFESFDVFSRTSGETSDIVTKEMYDFHDKGDRHITFSDYDNINDLYLISDAMITDYSSVMLTTHI